MASAPTVVPSSSCSSSASPMTYDVFLSFRGADTRHNFTHDLYAALVEKGIKTFKDDEEIKIGDVISEALERAIKKSKFAIIIFSRNYASSTWCLEELSLIMERWERHGQKVFSVFLNGVNPLDVKHQKGSFGEPFGLHEQQFGPEMTEKWRSALRRATADEVSGWSFKDFG
ncbi:toll/interleukin-1 receptor-like protein [Macadamia integrifolia]|uniref:toll/interleukin-1 receptor-like protein n=1 Tax=Macadamia integrifolia TaxID=60698 RepID=UPI001C4FF287|nr:toll/interleukin-1 receptor-like protein [Macadamia integrifolia]